MSNDKTDPIPAVVNALRELADRIDSLAGCGLPQMSVSINVQPHTDHLPNAEKVGVVDTLGSALVHKVGATEPMINGTWHHDASGRIGPLGVGVFDRVDDPNAPDKDAELARLRAELADAQERLAGVTDAAEILGVALGRCSEPDAAEAIETPEQSAAIVDANLMRMGLTVNVADEPKPAESFFTADASMDEAGN